MKNVNWYPSSVSIINSDYIFIVSSTSHNWTWVCISLLGKIVPITWKWTGILTSEKNNRR